MYQNIKTFSELTAIASDRHLITITLRLSGLQEVVIELGQHIKRVPAQDSEMSVCLDHPLLAPIQLVVRPWQAVLSLHIDGHDMIGLASQDLDRDDQQGILTIEQPFYRWLHHRSGQGWLLEP